MDVDAVEEGSADLAEVLLDLSGGAAAFARRVAVEPAFAGVHVSNAA